MARLTTATRKGLSAVKRRFPGIIRSRVDGGAIPEKIPVLPAGPIPTKQVEKIPLLPKEKKIDKFAGIKIQHQGKQLTVQEFQKQNPSKRIEDIPGMSKALKKAAKANIRLNRRRGGLVAKISEDVKKQIETFRNGGKVKFIGGAGAVKFVDGKFINVKHKKAS